MINSLRLKNFKCFLDEEISFGGLTVLAGMNGAGKSSVAHAILALYQMAKTKRWPWRGPLVNLGSFRDVLHDSASEDAVRIAISSRKGTFHFHSFPKGVGSSGGNGVTLLENGDVRYISADRLGPRSILPYEEGWSASSATPLGKRGEHVLHYLDVRGHDLVDPAVRHPSEPKNTLAAQTNAWLSVISPGVELEMRVIPEADCAVAGYRYRRGTDVPSRAFRPRNVGFGISYALPPIVALLAPKVLQRNEGIHLTVIENPEAHIHPAGQTSMAELAAKTVAGGSQVILETHSDHVLNGVRLAVAEGILSPDQVVIHYFEREGLDVKITTPAVTRSGKLDIWPQGFFDQHERNLSRLIGIPE